MAERGVLMTAVTRGAKLAEKTIGVPLGVARAIRDQVFRVTFAGVDRFEGFNQSAVKVARDLLERMDKLSQEAMSGLEAAVAELSKPAGESCEAAPEPTEVDAEETQPRPRVAAPV
jgi:hypothetical protein